MFVWPLNISDLESIQARYSSVVDEISDILNHIDVDSSHDGSPKIAGGFKRVDSELLMVLMDLSNRIREARQA